MKAIEREDGLVEIGELVLTPTAVPVSDEREEVAGWMIWRRSPGCAVQRAGAMIPREGPCISAWLDYDQLCDDEITAIVDWAPFAD